MRLMRARRPEARTDEGFAMVTVIGTMFVLALFVLTVTAFAVNAIPSSRHAQDYAAALAAAQAGADDVLSRLNNDDAYWTSAKFCADPAAELGCWDGAEGGPQSNRWATVPGSGGTFPARYRYALVSTPATTPGLIRVQVDGEVNEVRRSITVDLRKKSFLEFIYYTDKESSSPSVVVENYPPRTEYSEYYTNVYRNGRVYAYEWEGVSAAAADACKRYYYSVPPATGARSEYSERYRLVSTRSNGTDRQSHTGWYSQARSCDINFVGGDDIKGPMYTNDAMLLLNRNGIGPRFYGKTETYWQPSYSPAAPVNGAYRKNGSTAAPHPDGYVPTSATRKVDMPPSNQAIQSAAEAGGCVYVGPTRIVLKSNGTMDVTSPLTPGGGTCGVGGGRALPENGVVFVKSSTASCTGKPTAYPLRSDDITPYDCRAGDVFLEGTLKGQLTIASQRDIVVTDDVKYSQEVWNGSVINSAVTDVLGLVAQGSVKVYHPVRCGQSLPSTVGCAPDGYVDLPGTPRDIRIDAAILSVDNSFTVQNYQRGGHLGDLQVRGGIYQKHRGAVGQGDAGYLKDYVYDTRLISLPPPYFLEPAGAAWGIVGFSE
ncbi:hypothetical protein [Thalassiella azotivora]